MGRRYSRDTSAQDLALMLHMLQIMGQYAGTPAQARQHEWNLEELQKTQEGQRALTALANKMGAEREAAAFSRETGFAREKHGWDVAATKQQLADAKELAEFQKGLQISLLRATDDINYEKATYEAALREAMTLNDGNPLLDVDGRLKLLTDFRSELAKKQFADTIYRGLLAKADIAERVGIETEAVNTKSATSQPAGLTEEKAAQFAIRLDKANAQQEQLLQDNLKLGHVFGMKAWQNLSPSDRNDIMADPVKGREILRRAIVGALPTGDSSTQLNSIRLQLLDKALNPKADQTWELSTGGRETDAMVGTQVRGLLEELRERGKGYGITGEEAAKGTPLPEGRLSQIIGEAQERLLLNHAPSSMLESLGAAREEAKSLMVSGPDGHLLDLSALQDRTFRRLVASPDWEDTYRKYLSEYSSATGRPIRPELVDKFVVATRQKIADNPQWASDYRKDVMAEAQKVEKDFMADREKLAAEYINNGFIAERMQTLDTKLGGITSLIQSGKMRPEMSESLKLIMSPAQKELEYLRGQLPDNTPASAWWKRLNDLTASAPEELFKRTQSQVTAGSQPDLGMKGLIQKTGPQVTGEPQMGPPAASAGSQPPPIASLGIPFKEIPGYGGPTKITVNYTPQATPTPRPMPAAPRQDIPPGGF